MYMAAILLQTKNKVVYFKGLNTKNQYYENVLMLQMKIYTFFFQQVSLFSNFEDDFLKNHALENCSFFSMQIGTIRNPITMTSLT